VALPAHDLRPPAPNEPVLAPITATGLLRNLIESTEPPTGDGTYATIDFDGRLAN
jgi:hypothetical protein